MDSPTWSRLPTLVAKLAALDQSPILSIWVDQDGIVGYVNNKLCKTFGFEQKELLSEQITRLAPSLKIDRWKTEWWSILKQDRQILSFPVSWQNRSGESLKYPTGVSLVEASDLEFAQFSIWPESLYFEIQEDKSSTSENSLLDDLGVSVCVLNRLGDITYANPAMCVMLAGSKADLIGQSFLQILALGENNLHFVWECLHEKRTETEFKFTNSEGVSFQIRMNVVVKESQQLVSFIDITEQKRIGAELEMRNASHERLASNIPGFIYTFRLTPEGVMSFPYASQGCRDIFGVDPADVVDDATPIAETIHPDFQQQFLDSVLESARTMRPWNFEARLNTVEGEWKWFHAASRPELQINGDIVWEGLVMDISAPKKIEAELAVAKESAEASAQARAEFLANMSHEIRTPLNGIIGLTRLVVKTELDSAQRDTLTKVQTSSELLLGIINGVLDFSKIESGKLKIEQVNFQLESVLQHVGYLLEPKAAEKGLEFLIRSDSNIPHDLIGDPLRLEQILINLCNNAIKFTEHGEVILLVESVDSTEAETRLKFLVKDTGIGLTKDQQTKIFDSFTQADASTTRQYGGTGLGLTICKHLTGLMGGEISVNSELGEGSEFSFLISFSIDGNAALQPLVKDCTGDTDFRGLRVLIAEDNTINQEVAQRTLESEGIIVEIVADGQQAVERIMKNSDRYDMVFMDLQMPEMDGFEATRIIRSEKRFDRLPIIAMTAHAMESEKIKCEQAGMQGHVGKPIDPEHLFSTIARWTAKREKDLQQDASLESENPKLNTQCKSPHIESLSTVDINSALKMLAGNEQALIQLLQRFYFENHNLVDRLTSSISEGSYSQAADLAHQVKGVAGNLRIVRIYETISELEKLLCTGSDNDYSGLLIVIEEEVQRFKDEMRLLGFVPDTKEPEDSAWVDWYDDSTALDQEKVMLALGQLIDNLDSNNLKAETCLQELLYLFNGLFGETGKTLSDQVAGLDYKDAAKTARLLHAKLSSEFKDVQNLIHK